jgi:hypothetical protein
MILRALPANGHRPVLAHIRLRDVAREHQSAIDMVQAF